MLLLHVGTDLCRLAGEMDKLVLAVAKGERTVTAQLVEKQTGVNREYNDFELQTALANHDIDRAARIVKFFQGNPRSFALQRVLSNLFTFFSDVMIAFYSPDRSDRGVAAWMKKSEAVRYARTQPFCRNGDLSLILRCQPASQAACSCLLWRL